MVLFNLCVPQPDFALSFLRERPGLLLIGVDPSGDEMLVLSSHPAQALSMSDLVQVVNQTDFNSEQFVSSMGASLQGSADAMLPDVVIFDLVVAQPEFAIALWKAQPSGQKERMETHE